MRIGIIAPRPVPDAWGGAERAVQGVAEALTDLGGHDVEVVKLPVDERTLPGVIDGYRAFAALDVSGFDRVITMKYPAWMVDHPHHTVLMFHPLRGLYDTYHLFGEPPSEPPATREVGDLRALMASWSDRAALDELFGLWDHALDVITAEHQDLRFPGPFAREVVHWLDRIALSPTAVVRHLALSWTVARRPDYFPPGVHPGVVHLPGHLTPTPDGDQERRGFFTASRLDGPKRLDLLVDAMAHVPGDVPLHIAGTGPLADDLAARAAADPRIELLGFVPDDELADRYRGAIAVPFIPEDEDLGLVTLEAFSQATPVVTCTDSGGPTELVADGISGLVANPDPASLGRALSRLAANPRWARELGRNGQRRAARVTWAGVVDALVGEPRRRGTVPAPEAAPANSATARVGRSGRSTRRPGRPKVVVTTTFAIDDPRHGGQLRSRHLYGELARTVDVEVVALVDRGQAAGRLTLAPGFDQVAVPRSAAHAAAGEERSHRVQMPVTDIVAGTDIWATPAYLDALRHAARGAAGIVLAEPYLQPALAEADIALPSVYDAFNLEALLKAEALPDTVAGRALLAQVVAVEGAAVREAAAITACSEPDAEGLAQRYGRDLDAFTVIPNGTIVPATVPTPAERAALRERWLARYRLLGPGGRPPTHLAVFFGSWHPPNLDAVALLADVAAALPRLLIISAGSHGLAFTERVVPPNLVFAGMVSDRAKAKLLAAADVALNPMRTGSGTNLKLIEYLAAGVPVVSTGFGVRGVDVADGRHLLVADPEHFADAVAASLAEPDAAAARAARGRIIAAEGYGWPALGARFAEVVTAVIGDRASRPHV